MTVVERSDISKISSVCQSSRAGILSKEGGMGKFAHPWGKYVKLPGNYIQSHLSSILDSVTNRVNCINIGISMHLT